MTPLEQKLLEQERFPGARISDENQVGAVGNKAALLICDELGYLALDQQSSNLFYQVISTRHSQKRSSLITTNTPFSDLDRIVTAKETSSDTKGEPHSKRRSYLVQNSRFDPVLDSSGPEWESPRDRGPPG
jgi:hypothetical protein